MAVAFWKAESEVAKEFEGVEEDDGTESLIADGRTVLIKVRRCSK